MVKKENNMNNKKQKKVIITILIIFVIFALGLIILGTHSDCDEFPFYVNTSLNKIFNTAKAYLHISIALTSPPKYK